MLKPEQKNCIVWLTAHVENVKIIYYLYIASRIISGGLALNQKEKKLHCYMYESGDKC